MKIPRISPWELKILQTLINQTMYGLQIKKEVEERYGDEISEGTLYPTLHRMYKKGLLDASWGNPVEEFKGARRKYYTVSSVGISALRQFQIPDIPIVQIPLGNVTAIPQ